MGFLISKLEYLFDRTGVLIYNSIMNKDRLTEIRKEVLVSIYTYVEEQRERGIATPIPPPLRGLLPMINRTSTYIASYHVKSLQTQGYLAPPDRPKERGTRLTDAGYAKAKELIFGVAEENDC